MSESLENLQSQAPAPRLSEVPDDPFAGEMETPRVESEIDLSRILDIPLEVSVELGRQRMPIQELLRLTQGSVVELNKLAGEPLNVVVHGRLIARGEAVVINDKFGVRLNDIVSPEQRIERLGGAWK